jgi:hypothetical protein
MVDINSYLGSNSPLKDYLGDGGQTNDAARQIDGRSVAITPLRNSTALTARTVRVDPLEGNASNRQGTNEWVAPLRVLVTDLRYATASDNLQRGDRFLLDGQDYLIVQLVPGLVYSTQALAEAR